jgi:hypothetical protein
MLRVEMRGLVALLFRPPLQEDDPQNAKMLISRQSVK